MSEHHYEMNSQEMAVGCVYDTVSCDGCGGCKTWIECHAQNWYNDLICIDCKSRMKCLTK